MGVNPNRESAADRIRIPKVVTPADALAINQGQANFTRADFVSKDRPASFTADRTHYCPLYLSRLEVKADERYPAAGNPLV